MTTLAFRRLAPSLEADREAWREVFRAAPSFVHATEGRRPTDEDADRMIDTVPQGYGPENLFFYAVYADEDLCGGACVARDYPVRGEAQLVLLVLMERFQHRTLGVRCLAWIEGEAERWGSTRLTGVVDAANRRALRFWQRLGFQEQRRQRLPGLVGEGVIGFIPLHAGEDREPTSSARLRRTAGTFQGK